MKGTLKENNLTPETVDDTLSEVQEVSSHGLNLTSGRFCLNLFKLQVEESCHLQAFGLVYIIRQHMGVSSQFIYPLSIDGNMGCVNEKHI